MPDEHYWLAEVERLADLPKDSQLRQEVIAFLDHYSDDDIISGPELHEILEKKKTDPFLTENTKIQALDRALDPILEWVIEWDGLAVLDFRDYNIMLRPSTNELVWSDPM